MKDEACSLCLFSLGTTEAYGPQSLQVVYQGYTRSGAVTRATAVSMLLFMWETGKHNAQTS